MANDAASSGIGFTRLVGAYSCRIVTFFIFLEGKVTKPEWGLKRLCPSCGTRYYDMRKNPPVCPSCGTIFDPEQVLKVRRKAAPADEKARKAQPSAAADDIEDIVPIEGDDTDAVIEDAEELGDEDADLEEVVEIEDDAAEDDQER